MKYWLEHKIYMDTKRLIATYPQLVEEYDAIIHASKTQDGQPHGTGIGDPTGRTAERLIGISIQMDAIYKSLQQIPEGYRMHIFNKIVYKKPFPPYANICTWRNWQYRYIYLVRRYLDEKQK